MNKKGDNLGFASWLCRQECSKLKKIALERDFLKPSTELTPD
jgi:hypothetical protein